MKFTLKNLAIREKFLLFAKRLFDFLLLGNIVFWGGFGVGEIIFKFNWNEVIALIPACGIWIIGGLSTLGIVFRRKELSQKQGLFEFWKSSFLYIAGYFRNAPQEQEGIEPPPRKKPKVKRFLIAGSVLLLMVIGVILIIQYREENPESYGKSGGVTEEKLQNAYDAGLTPKEVIDYLRGKRQDVADIYDSWLRQGLDAESMLEKVIEMDAARRGPISNVKLSPSDVELFDMRLDGTGGYKALSGRVQNKSAKVIEEIRLSITLYNLAGKPIDSGTATISCSIPPFAVRSVTGDVTEMTPPAPLTKPAPRLRPSEAELEKKRKEGWKYIMTILGDATWQKSTWTWNYQILSVTGRKGQLGNK